MWDDLEPDVFTVASVDNIDMLQSHAAVYCGDQSRSYQSRSYDLTMALLFNWFNLAHRTKLNTSCSFGECRECTKDETTNEIHSHEVSTHEVSTDAPTWSQSATTKKRVISNSPANSLHHKHGKVGPKRPRTLVPRSLQQLTATIM